MSKQKITAKEKHLMEQCKQLQKDLNFTVIKLVERSADKKLLQAKNIELIGENEQLQ